MSKELVWYFDVISPFAYLQWCEFERLPGEVNVTLQPVLLAGILGHWGSIGPAEIPEKRRFTYRQVQWRAEQRRVPFRLPPFHPFNPLRPLRLCVALGTTPAVVDTIFRFIWAEGRDVNELSEWRELCSRLAVDDPETLIQDDGVKNRLRDDTRRACEAGIFGVPTFVAGGEIFWGADATGMLLDYLKDPAMFSKGEMRRASNLPVGVQRRTRP